MQTSTNIEVGTQFIGNGGYPATVIGPTRGVPGMYDVRYPGGTCCQSAYEIEGCIAGRINDRLAARES